MQLGTDTMQAIRFMSVSDISQLHLIAYNKCVVKCVVSWNYIFSTCRKLYVFQIFGVYMFFFLYNKMA